MDTPNFHPPGLRVPTRVLLQRPLRGEALSRRFPGLYDSRSVSFVYVCVHVSVLSWFSLFCGLILKLAVGPPEVIPLSGRTLSWSLIKPNRTMSFKIVSFARAGSRKLELKLWDLDLLKFASMLEKNPRNLKSSKL